MARLSRQLVDAQAEVVGRMLAGGFLRLYGGRQPRTADESVDDQPLLAELRFGAFAPPVSGVVAAVEITPDADARGSAEATWFRALSAGGTPVLDGAVGVELDIGDVEIRRGARIVVTSFAHRVPQ